LRKITKGNWMKSKEKRKIDPIKKKSELLKRERRGVLTKSQIKGHFFLNCDILDNGDQQKKRISRRNPASQRS
jgi:hypothetical protein